jgi:hypothetical protein
MGSTVLLTDALKFWHMRATERLGIERMSSQWYVCLDELEKEKSALHARFIRLVKVTYVSKEYKLTFANQRTK